MGREILLVLTCLLMVGGWAAADDYYMLVREWPGTICLNTTCKYMENFNGSILNLHGLWYQGGQSRNCQHPQNCLNISFDQNALSLQTRTDMSKQWVGVFNDSASFHDHEWTKHGTCYEYDQIHPTNILRSDPYMDSYFKKAMELNSANNFISLLAAKGIHPNLATGYQVEVLYAALGTTKGNSLLSCKNINNNYFFAQMMLCFSKKWQVVNCACPPAAGAGTVACPSGKPIFIPPIKS